MSHTIAFTDRKGVELTLEILDREEYFKLSDIEKIEYSSSPKIDNCKELGVQEFIWGLVEANDPGESGVPEILEEFMKENYPTIFNDWLKNFIDNGEGEWSDRNHYFWSILDEKADNMECNENKLDPIDKSDIYFLDHAYSQDSIYELTIDTCKKMTAKKGFKYLNASPNVGTYDLSL